MAIFSKQNGLEAKLLVHFAEDDQRFTELKELVPQVTEVKDKLQGVTDELKEKKAVDEAVAEVTRAAAEDSKKAAEDSRAIADQQISKKQFIATTAIGVGSIGAIVWSALAASGQL